MQNKEYLQKERLTKPWNWRSFMREQTLRTAESPKYREGIRVSRLQEEDDGPVYEVSWPKRKSVRIETPAYDEYYYGTDPDYCTEVRNIVYYERDYYVAAALLACEKKYGQLQQVENARLYSGRMKWVEKVENAEKNLEAMKMLPAVSLPVRYFQSSDKELLVSLPDLLKDMKVYEADGRTWQRYLQRKWNVQVLKADRHMNWSATITWEDTDFFYRVQCVFSPQEIQSIRTVITTSYRDQPGFALLDEQTKDSPMYVFTASALSMLNRYINQHAAYFCLRTSTTGRNLLTLMEEEVLHPQAQEQKIMHDIVMQPRLLDGKDGLVLTFRIGYAYGKTVILKNYDEFFQAVVNKGTFMASRTIDLDFYGHTFDEESLPYYRLAEGQAEQMMEYNALTYNRYGVKVLNYTRMFAFQGALADRFYEISEGKRVEYIVQTAGKKENYEIPVGHRDAAMKLTIDEIRGGSGTAGVQVRVDMPSRISGAMSDYVLDEKGLSRLTPEELKMFRPFDTASVDTGTEDFTVAKQDLRTFYTRVLPRLAGNPNIEIADHAREEVKPILPPEAQFTFRMDLQDEYLICQSLVSYGDTAMTLGMKSGVSVNSDKTLENAVIEMLKEVFDAYDQKRHVYYAEADDQRLYSFLMHDLAKLEAYGTVEGTDAFNKLHVRPAPKMMLGVSVSDKAGLMDLKLTSPDADPEELAAILQSYHQHKRFHRLRSGDFIDLDESDAIEDVEQLFQQLDLDDLEAVKDQVSAPLYRALYVDKLLEKHDDIAARRDSTIRTLIKNFHDIKDSDIEVPKETAGILRPYQEYGFKWLAVLEKTGFGGILADEMGLGKTLQMITLFLYNKENHEEKSSLVVCPASLVYNWEEEIHRFAPSLKAVPVAGLPAKRKEALNSQADVYITSYDLLKRDLKLYEDRSFCVCVIDEAQYIKNASAAQSKAVKVIQAQHRFALTGTPIENRLSELWSIFDFLMPGLLYNNKTFVRNFETPIVKNQDSEAAEKLRGFTGPFILRRKKEEVLKDLPEKLEETRYARMEGEQQKLYDAEVAHMKKMLTMGMKEKDPSEKGKDKIKILAELTRIRQICCDPSLAFENYTGESAKREACVNLIQTAMEEGHRMLVFSQFTSMLALLEEDLQKAGIRYYKIIGATPKEQRIEMVKAFNHDDVPVFLISLKAGGTGLNLTGADVVIHYDPWWNVAAQNQATDRAHRIGQTRKVTVYRLIMKDTIEEKIMNLQSVKQDLADTIIEGDHTSLTQMSPEELMALLD